MNLQKILSGEIGLITSKELEFAIIGAADEMRYKHRTVENFGEYLDLLAHYIDFYRRQIKEEGLN